MPRIGVFVCWCGRNIAATVNIDRVKKDLKGLPGVAAIYDYHYFCSEPGQALILKTIKENNLDSIVVASCSPNLHEMTFQRTAELAGLNPYRCEIANIREQCSWVHSNIDEATSKATDIIRTVIEKVRFNEPLLPAISSVLRRALVIGGGIAGIETALDIAKAGFEVVLLEKNAALGGHMARLSDTYPNFESATTLLTSKLSELKGQKNVRVFTSSELRNLEGYIGKFKAKILRKPKFVDWQRCDGCMECLKVCPVQGDKPAIYIPYPHLMTNSAVIDQEQCQFFDGKCNQCREVCPKNAIDFVDQEIELEEEFGAIVMATGYELHPIESFKEYGGGRYQDVIDNLKFEALLAKAKKDKLGEVQRPSDGKTPKQVVFVQCVGLENPTKTVPYCSKICCMSTAKQAFLYKQAVPDGMVYVFYTNLGAGGKNFEEFVNKSWSDNNTLYLRGKVSEITQRGEKLIVHGEDTLINRKIDIESDLVVLCPALIGGHGAQELARRLKLNIDAYGFYTEAHPKLRPLESLTSGFYLAGCGQGPKDINETIAHASGAAMKVSILFSSGELAHTPIVAWVDEELCVGCGLCVSACMYGAREINPYEKVARVSEILCQACGACITACPNGATQQKNFSKNQILSMIDAIG